MPLTTRNALLRRPSKILAAAFVAAALVSPVRFAMAEQPTATALTVSLTTPAQRDWPETVPASGWLKPWQEAVIASETSGLRITDVLADVGSVVTKGQTLVRLSQESVMADLRKQEAAVENAKASLSKAKANADRARQLRSSGALSDEKIVEYLADEQTATASLASEEAALGSEKIKLAQTTVTAVDDGLITSRSADLGAVVSAGTELFRMVRQQRVEWQAEVSARYLPRISEGMRVKISGPEGQVIDGKVRLVGPAVSTDTSRAIVYVALPADVRPRTGLYVTGNIELQTSSALTVPETAIVFRDGISYLFTSGVDQRVQRVRVETGRRNNGEVEIVSGIDRSSKVVTSGGAFLSDNDLVKIAEKN
ncbi:probable efflux cation transporter protein (plasmid) [Rhizobium etli CFN 42]|uniref:Probable efflux cation transporter protein n=1 Tax=Rhizobium etli (strain ATCC 51251 / DSM 11541 / JCM 21823 / NBRC 15573 / CFN 42) TaxID=347834 RepID=Q2K1A3_RHIEC|nr:efflux RND transporter periplasmic adaptor subunit [Rhizobium etli]ABC93263.1 probable efflux cation transporter protein [Rhizobium etli CFN 42]